MDSKEIDLLEYRIKQQGVHRLLLGFIEESNKIEGIMGVSSSDIHAHQTLLSVDRITIEDLERFTQTIDPKVRLRDREGMDCRVGGYYPPPGGIQIREKLNDLLCFAVRDEEGGSDLSPFEFHVRYEALHPFTDCNGRSGRALWLWMRNGVHPGMDKLPFLQRWYYDALGFYPGSGLA